MTTISKRIAFVISDESHNNGLGRKRVIRSLQNFYGKFRIILCRYYGHKVFVDVILWRGAFLACKRGCGPVLNKWEIKN